MAQVCSGVVQGLGFKGKVFASGVWWTLGIAPEHPGPCGWDSVVSHLKGATTITQGTISTPK